MGDEIVTVASRGFAVPNRVLELLQDSGTNASATGVSSFPSAASWPDPVECL